MNWQEISGGIMQAFRNAGVKKDVIDLQEKQLDLLTKQIVTLEGEKSDLLTKVSRLDQKVAELELELERVRPKSDLHPDAIRFLKLLFEHDGLTVSRIAATLGISKGMAEHHCDTLLHSDMVGLPSITFLGHEPEIFIQSQGRSYLVRRGLVQ